MTESPKKFSAADSTALDQVFEQAPSFMAVTQGPRHVFAKINRNYAKLIQVNKEVVGHSVEEILPEVRAQGFIGLLDEVYRSGEPYFGTEVPVQFVAEDGTERQVYVDFAYQPIRDPAGQVQGIMMQGFDVTDKVRARQAIENERMNFRNLFRQTPEMVCITRGPDHVFEFVNEAHIKALGFDATGLGVREAQPESVEVHGILDDVYRTGRTAELREIPVTVTDRLRYFNLTYAARRDQAGQIEGVMILGVEITQAKEAEKQLEEAVRIRDEFISIASHELKTPITSLKLSTQLTARKIRRGIVPNTAELLRFLDGSVERLDQLTRLIEDMLDVSRLAAGRLKIDPQPANLADLAREAFGHFRDEFRNAGIDVALEVQCEPAVNVDKLRLEQVVVNLLSNALKYGAGKPVQMKVGAAHGFATIQVIDQGIGITPEAQGVIFERFERAKTDKNIGGLGLGLYISRQIVEAHGGGIEVESTAGTGSRFTVSLPLLA